ncbi:sigma-70 family RNA polymerase sigma factor [Methylobacterium sp. WL9]|uniref:RNA polymerase sigma factor n=1 Tax=Methylobacterium sp. WL9 TaxID=2603898 RepID=UPI0011CB2711|nr:sigma-70 family RNA polymerase sigma factor [Methylobacterium sp. WL9]TXN19660.1 sigma-70 family RNA polymerase sigma factor [Methylobacterium sp. WL9]
MEGVSIDALHRREGLKLQRFLRRLLENPADAADATQETYLRMLAALTRTNIEHPTALLFRVAHNVALRMRNRQRLERTLFAATTDADLAGIVDGYALPERDTIARQELKRLAAAIDALPPRCRAVFLLSRVDGLANGEIALRLGVTRNMVEKHIIKALLHCRRCSLDFF